MAHSCEGVISCWIGCQLQWGGQHVSIWCCAATDTYLVAIARTTARIWYKCRRLNVQALLVVLVTLILKVLCILLVIEKRAIGSHAIANIVETIPRTIFNIDLLLLLLLYEEIVSLLLMPISICSEMWEGDMLSHIGWRHHLLGVMIWICRGCKVCWILWT